jgi:outer membrane protein TolC
LLAADLMVAGRRAQWSLAKQDWLPDLTLGIKAINTDPARMPGVEDSGKDPLAVTFAVNLPLWWGKYRNQAREKGAQYRAAVYQRTDLFNQLEAQVAEVLYDYREARQTLDLYQQSLLLQAEQHLAVTRQAFASGATDFLDLIEAQRTHLEFQLAALRARVDRGQKLAELEKLIGRQVPRSGR